MAEREGGCAAGDAALSAVSSAAPSGGGSLSSSEFQEQGSTTAQLRVPPHSPLSVAESGSSKAPVENCLVVVLDLNPRIWSEPSPLVDFLETNQPILPEALKSEATSNTTAPHIRRQLLYLEFLTGALFSSPPSRFSSVASLTPWMLASRLAVSAQGLWGVWLVRLRCWILRAPWRLWE